MTPGGADRQESPMKMGLPASVTHLWRVDDVSRWYLRCLVSVDCGDDWGFCDASWKGGCQNFAGTRGRWVLPKYLPVAENTWAPRPYFHHQGWPAWVMVVSFE